MPEQKYKVPQSVKNNAKLALKKRKESSSKARPGGTEVGVQRAYQLINSDYIDLGTIKKMYSFFSRHEIDKSSKAWKEAEAKGEWSPGKVAWGLWGGDSGFAFAKRIAEANK